MEHFGWEAWPFGAMALEAAATFDHLPAPPVATRVLNDPSNQRAERPARMCRKLRHQGRRRHSRLRIHFQTDQFTRSPRRIVEPEVSARHPAATQRLMRRKREFPYGMVNIW